MSIVSSSRNRNIISRTITDMAILQIMLYFSLSWIYGRRLDLIRNPTQIYDSAIGTICMFHGNGMGSIAERYPTKIITGRTQGLVFNLRIRLNRFVANQRTEMNQKTPYAPVNSRPPYNTLIIKCLPPPNGIPVYVVVHDCGEYLRCGNCEQEHHVRNDQTCERSCKIFPHRFGREKKPGEEEEQRHMKAVNKVCNSFIRIMPYHHENYGDSFQYIYPCGMGFHSLFRLCHRFLMISVMSYSPKRYASMSVGSSVTVAL